MADASPRLSRIDVTVVVPMYNGADTIGAQLTALAAQQYDRPWEIILADNGSCDGSRRVAERFVEIVPNLRIVDASDVRGVSHARNVGAQAGSGRCILYTDADDVVTPGWVSALAAGLDKCDMVGGSLDKVTLNHATTRESAACFRPRDHLPTVYNFLPTASGNNFGIRRTVLEAIGGWREDYIYGEDVEICWRAQVAGYSLCFVPEAVVQYRYRSTLKGLARQKFFRARQDHRMRLVDDFGPHGYRPPTDAQKARETIVWIVANAPGALADRRNRRLWVRKVAYGLGWVVGKWDRRGRPARARQTARP